MPIIASIASAAIKVYGYGGGVVDFVRDSLFKTVSLLLKGNIGSPTDAVLTVPPPFNQDASSNSYLLTTNGSPKVTKFVPFSDTYSLYFNGSTNLTHASLNSGYSGQQFTFEVWIYSTAYSGSYSGAYSACILGSGNGSNGFEYELTGTSSSWTGITFYARTGGSATVNFPVNYTFVLNKWYHVALVQTATTLTHYINGVSVGSTTAGTWTDVQIYVGYLPASGYNYWFNGYMSNLRITKSAVYTTNFTPSTTPLTNIANTVLLIGVTNTLADISSNAYALTVTGTPVVSHFNPLNVSNTILGSASFNSATSDYFTVTTPNLSGTWTIEFWWYPTVSATQQSIISFNNGSYAGINIWVNTSNQLVVDDGANAQSAWTTVTFRINTWHHVAIVRNGTTTTGYINGVVTGSHSFTPQTTAVAHIGRYNSSPFYYLNGYLSNLRIVNGTAIVPPAGGPTSSLAAVTNTSLLTFQYGGSFVNYQPVDNSNQHLSFTKNGNATQSIFTPYRRNYSVSFNGTTDYLSVSTTGLTIPTSTTPFTVEAWVYMTAAGGCLFSSSVATYVGTTIAFTMYNTTGLTDATNSNQTGGQFIAFGWYNGSAWQQVMSTTQVYLNMWTHIACVFTGSATKIYINGSDVTTGTLATWGTNSLGTWYIGRRWDTVAVPYFSGYISNFNHVIGTALYTGAFTPGLYPSTPTNTTALLTCVDGTYTDTSKNQYTITQNGTPKVVAFGPYSTETAQYNPGYFSTYFNGNYLTSTVSANSNIGTNDFTVEFWFYTTNVGANYSTYWNLGQYTTGIMYRQNYTGIEIYIVNSQVFSPVGTVTANTWNHTALTRSGTSLKLFLNGVQIGSTTNSTNIGPTAAMMWGTSAHATTTEYWYGYMSNFRFVIGTALYTSAFTVPTAPLSLVTGTTYLGMQNDIQIDNSQYAWTITPTGTPMVKTFNPFQAQSPIIYNVGVEYNPNTVSGSSYFDGTGDYWLSTDYTYHNFNVADFTVEAWVYLNQYNATWGSHIYGSNHVYGVSADTLFGIKTNGTLQLQFTTTTLTSTGTVPLRSWAHVAWCRVSGVAYMFINGVNAGGGGAFTTTGVAAGNISVGADKNGAAASTMYGYISDVRVEKGYGRYVSNFLPPVQKLTNTKNTILLLNFDNTPVYDAVGLNSVENGSTATLSTQVVKFGTSSMYFNGTNSYNVIPFRPELDILSTDFTVECWVYSASTAANQMVIGQWLQVANSGGWAFGVGSSAVFFSLGSVSEASAFITSSTTINLNTWYHITVVRFGSNFTMYINGNSVGTGTSTTTRAALSSVNLSMGNYYAAAGTMGAASANYFSGYVDDLRISRVARYLGNFTPPTTSYTDYGPSLLNSGSTGSSGGAGAVVVLDGLTPQTAGLSAAAIKTATGTNLDGVYWINLPTVGPTPIYCLMNSAVNGGGWMMAMKATRGTTFNYSATHWNTNTVLNVSQTNRNDGDAKFNTMNYFQATDIIALWPDITTNGGSLGTNPYSCWSWQETNFNAGTKTTLINFFNTAGTYNTGNVNTAGNHGGYFIKDAKTFSGWASGVFTSQADVRFYGFNYKNGGLTYGGAGSCRWGFGWNENGEGLYVSPATMEGGAASGSNDVWGGIGMDSNGGSYSAGDYYSCCSDSNGIQRSARVEIYIR